MLVFAAFHKLLGRRISLVLSASVLLICVYGMAIGFHKLTIVKEIIECETLPESFDGYRIVHLSDLHLGSYTKSSKFVGRVVDSVLALRPDLIVFTGDLVNTDAAEAEPFVKELSRLKAPDGVYAVSGNHDYGFDKSKVDEAFSQFCDIVNRAGWTILNNSNSVIRHGADSIYVLGVENTSKSFFISRGDLGKALEGTQDGDFKILLTHDPNHWRAEVLPATDIALTLSGHTHAMQLKVFGLSPAALIFKEWSGKYTSEDGRSLYVSEGIGGIFPFRLGSYPQIAELTLKKK
ncbi:MAG: metallophosphoesterase [Bacteroidales bacterium]|nr:metallophosphoesterase [Bacteroidales bacterium]